MADESFDERVHEPTWYQPDQYEPAGEPTTSEPGVDEPAVLHWAEASNLNTCRNRRMSMTPSTVTSRMSASR